MTDSVRNSTGEQAHSTSERVRWLLVGARVKTLPAAVVPVAVGTSVVSFEGQIIWWRVVAALVVSVSLQVATNFVNDYADGDRGTDDNRVGPTRLVGSGLVSSRAVKQAAAASFLVAGVSGGMLVLAVGWELVIVGVFSMLAGWAYTGGSNPYGYIGAGEVFVFIFFGVVATAGSTYVHTRELSGLSLAVSVPVGLLAVALLVINNLRDIPTDEASGKKTLAVRLGDRRTRQLFVGLFVVAAGVLGLCAFRVPLVPLAIVGLGLAIGPCRTVLGGAKGNSLIAVLEGTGRTQLFTGLLLSVMLFLS